MSKVELLRAFVNQRLTAAAEEICGLFERTIAEYEEEMIRLLQRDGAESGVGLTSEDLNHFLNQSAVRPGSEASDVINDVISLKRYKSRYAHRGKLPGVLDTLRSLGTALFPANVKTFTVIKDVPPEQHEWSSSLDQEDPEPPHIKEEQEELWTSQEGEQLQGLEEADITKFPFAAFPVKGEERQTENREAEYLKTEADGDCGGPEPARNSDPDRHLQPETGDSDDGLKQRRETQSGFSALRINEVSVYNTAQKSFSCSECCKTFSSKDHLLTHMKCHICQFCGKKFTKSSNLTTHLRVHTGEKPFSCSVCNTSFSLRCTLVNHMRVHTGEKPFICSVCSKRFSKKANLTTHMALHTEEKPFKCSMCDKRFTWHSQVKNHKCVVVDSSR